MKTSRLLALLVLVVTSEASRPPWYKPCWIYLCGVEFTDPVCAWDPRHGARLFRNDCEMNRHNFCYNRNYAIVDSDNNVVEDMKLCNRLKTIVENADEGKPSVVEDGNVRVHFLEEPGVQAEQRGQLWPMSRGRARTHSRYDDDSGSSQEDPTFLKESRF